MPYLLKILFKLTFFFFLWVHAPLAEGRELEQTCPIGFSSLFRKGKEEPLCYRRKGPEIFADKYKDCAGNLYTSDLLQELNFSKPDVAVWTEYKSLYPGGFFHDWSYSKNFGKVFNDVYEVSINSTLDTEEELCLVFDPVSNFTAVKCNKRYYSYCVIRSYISEGAFNGCAELKNSFRFWSPVSTCLTELTGVGGGALRATWNQAQELCGKNGASLLNKGWIYSNHPAFRQSSISHTYPLGIIMSNDLSLLRYDATKDHSEITRNEWNFDDKIQSSDTLLGSLQNNFWSLVNESYIFYEVICELHLGIRNVSLQVAIDVDNQITLTVNDSLHDDDSYCFTDSVKPIPTKVSKRRIYDTNVFILSPKHDGYYWCIHINTINFNPVQSKKVLFLREKESLVNTYSIKFQLNSYVKWSSKAWDHLKDDCEKKLRDYIYYRTKYVQIFGELNSNLTEDILKGFKNSNPGLKGKDKAILSMKLKRIYLDGRTVLVHVELNPDMKPVTPGYWDGIKVLHMKSVYYCKGFAAIPDKALGESHVNMCRNHTCIGDFNEGVQWVITAQDNCINPVNRALGFGEVTVLMPTASPQSNPSSPKLNKISDSSEEKEYHHTKQPTSETTTTDVPVTVTNTANTIDFSDRTESIAINRQTTEGILTTDITIPENYTTTTSTPITFPTTTTEVPTTRLPEEKLEQVIHDLDQLLNNSSPVMVEDINEVFDQVEDILEVHESLDIPSQLLHLLDSLGTTLNLNGSLTARKVRNNIALVIADATPSHPVRGMKIATRESDVFTNESFQIFSGNLNETDLDSERNEVVVQLPLYLSDMYRRVSFVVFRNDRAFRSNENSVNSRILSVKIENVTKFENDEFIDIHLSPIATNVERNESRACAYWKFSDNGTGYWSQEGCRLISASGMGMLSTCRCNHLTHFAEVLFPKSVFSQETEDILELLTLIGCCLSIFGLTMVGITAVLFRSWRREFSNKIWLQLCIAIFLLVLSFLIVIFAKFKEYSIPCMLLGVVLHYSVLSSFCWMLVAAVLSYRRLVLVFTRDASHKLLRASAFAYGCPCAIIGILLSASPQSYDGRFEEKSPTGSFCYPSGLALWISVYAPIAIILVANWTLFALIVRSVFSSRGIQRHGDSNEALRCASVSCLLVFLFGLPWIFGLFAFNVVMAYMFTLTATYQGLILFLFFVLGNKKTRDLWLNKLKIKQTRMVPVTSSTYSNRSTGWRAGTQPITIGAKSSKPKSLAQDDSRFS